MSSIKDRLIQKIRQIKGFEDATIDNLHPQPSRKIVDIPKWFYNNTCCYYTMTECVKYTLAYDRDLKEFFIVELNSVME